MIDTTEGDKLTLRAEHESHACRLAGDMLARLSRGFFNNREGGEVVAEARARRHPNNQARAACQLVPASLRAKTINAQSSIRQPTTAGRPVAS